MKDSKSISLMILSALLVGTWVFHIYDKTRYTKQEKIIYVRDTLAFRQHTHDSIEAIYRIALRDLPTGLDSIRNHLDSMQPPADSQQFAIYTESKEIAALLNKEDLTADDLDLVGKKITALRTLNADYQEPGFDKQEERKKLTALLQQLSGDFEGLEQDLQSLHATKK